MQRTDRYDAARKESGTYYDLSEANLIDSYYRGFSRAASDDEKDPILFSETLVAHFLERLKDGSLDSKALDKATERNAYLAALMKLAKQLPKQEQ